MSHPTRPSDSASKVQGDSWSDVQEHQRITRYWIEQAESASQRMAALLQALKHELLFNR